MATLAAGVLAACGTGDTNRSADPADTETEYIDGLPVSRSSAIFKFDLNNPEELAKFSDEIFTGTVVRKVKTEYLDEDGLDPLTVYEVQVDDNLDGTTPRTTMVGFGGGVTQNGKELLLPEGDDLLKPNRQYLFAGKRMSDGALDLVPIVGTDELDTATEEKVAERKYRAVGNR